MNELLGPFWLAIAEAVGWKHSVQLCLVSKGFLANFEYYIREPLRNDWATVLDSAWHLQSSSESNMDERNSKSLLRTAKRMLDDALRPKHDVVGLLALLLHGNTDEYSVQKLRQLARDFLASPIFSIEFRMLTWLRLATTKYKFFGGWSPHELSGNCAKKMPKSLQRLHAENTAGHDCFPESLANASTQVSQILSFIRLPNILGLHRSKSNGSDNIEAFVNSAVQWNPFNRGKLREEWNSVFPEPFDFELWTWQSPDDNQLRTIALAFDTMVRKGLHRCPIQKFPTRSEFYKQPSPSALAELVGDD